MVFCAGIKEGNIKHFGVKKGLTGKVYRLLGWVLKDKFYKD